MLSNAAVRADDEFVTVRAASPATTLTFDPAVALTAFAPVLAKKRTGDARVTRLGGLLQVSGRADLRFRELLRSNARRAGPVTDLRVLACTPPALVRETA